MVNKALGYLGWLVFRFGSVLARLSSRIGRVSGSSIRFCFLNLLSTHWYLLNNTKLELFVKIATFRTEKSFDRNIKITKKASDKRFSKTLKINNLVNAKGRFLFRSIAESYLDMYIDLSPYLGIRLRTPTLSEYIRKFLIEKRRFRCISNERHIRISILCEKYDFYENHN